MVTFIELSFGFHVEYDDEPSLKNKEARYLVVEACKEFELNREEGLLDWDEYCLDRAFVEVTELRREKSVSCRTDILPRVCFRPFHVFVLPILLLNLSFASFKQFSN